MQAQIKIQEAAGPPPAGTTTATTSAAAETFTDATSTKAATLTPEEIRTSGPKYPWQAPDGYPSATTAAVAAISTAAAPQSGIESASPRRLHVAPPHEDLATLHEHTPLAASTSLQQDELHEERAVGKKNFMLATNLPPPSTPSSSSRSCDLAESPVEGPNATVAFDPLTSDSYIHDYPFMDPTARAPWQAPSNFAFPGHAVSPEVWASGNSHPGQKTAFYPPVLPSDSFVSVVSQPDTEASAAGAQKDDVVPGYFAAADASTRPPASVASAPAGDEGHYYYEGDQNAEV